MLPAFLINNILQLYSFWRQFIQIYGMPMGPKLVLLMTDIVNWY